MDKISQKVTKDPKHVEAARKGRENYMNKLKQIILYDVKKAEILAMHAMKLPAPPTLPPPLPTALPTLPPVILIFKALVYLLSLSLAFAYFLHLTLPRLQIKNKSMKNRINDQKDGICFRKIYNKMSIFDWKKNIEDSIKYGLIITATTTGNAANVKSPKASIPGCHGYHETYQWNMWSGIGEILWALQEMDQRVMQQKLYGPLRAIKLPKSFQHVLS